MTVWFSMLQVVKPANSLFSTMLFQEKKLLALGWCKPHFNISERQVKNSHGVWKFPQVLCNDLWFFPFMLILQEGRNKIHQAVKINSDALSCAIQRLQKDVMAKWGRQTLRGFAVSLGCLETLSRVSMGCSTRGLPILPAFGSFCLWRNGGESHPNFLCMLDSHPHSKRPVNETYRPSIYTIWLIQSYSVNFSKTNFLSDKCFPSVSFNSWVVKMKTKHMFYPWIKLSPGLHIVIEHNYSNTTKFQVALKRQNLPHRVALTWWKWLCY